MGKMEMGSVVVCLGAKIVYSSQSEFRARAKRREGTELTGVGLLTVALNCRYLVRDRHIVQLVIQFI